MSTPFIEIPQRAEALPLITSRPPAPGRRRPTGSRRRRRSPVPDMMFSATPTPAVALRPAPWRACSSRRSSSRRARRSRPRPRRRGPTAIAWAPFGLATRQRDRDAGSRSCRRWFSSRTEAVARSTDSAAASRHAHATFARSHEYTRPGSGSHSSALVGPGERRRSPGTRRPSPPSRRSRPSPPACRRSGRGGPRSRRPCRRRRCRSRRGRRGSRAAPSRGRRPRRGARSGIRPRPRSRCRSGTRSPGARRTAPQPVVVRERAVVDQAEVEPGREGVGVLGRDPALGRHPGVPERVASPRRRRARSARRSRAGRPASL